MYPLRAIPLTVLDIPIRAEGVAIDGPCGHSTRIILNPTNGQVTHLVVDIPALGSTTVAGSRLVPIAAVNTTGLQQIRLYCRREQVVQFPPFLEMHYLKQEVPALGSYDAERCRFLPYVLPKRTVYNPVHQECLPPGEITVKCGVQVKATDGDLGQVAELLLDPSTTCVTHLVVRAGHLWGQHEWIIPITAIAHTYENRVYLHCDRTAIAALPSIPLQRTYHLSTQRSSDSD
ncbi:hypothetical protein [Trichothermofontia sp.]